MWDVYVVCVCVRCGVCGCVVGVSVWRAMGVSVAGVWCEAVIFCLISVLQLATDAGQQTTATITAHNILSASGDFTRAS